MDKPVKKPKVTNFSSGPCAKHPCFDIANLKDALFGRSHRSKDGKARINYAVSQMRELLGLPDDYLMAIVPGSDTGAIEMALWNILGERGVDVFYHDAFGQYWARDVVNNLHLDDVRIFRADYGSLPNVSNVDGNRDMVFVFNGTTSGVRYPNLDFVPDDREGLSICDATSAVFAYEMDWKKLDVVTFSWQKVLGGEAGHGVLILSPRAAKRIDRSVPSWPIPRLFNLKTADGLLNRKIFEGNTINTPSMLCIEDLIDALAWAKDLGGLSALMRRTADNLATIAAWVDKSDWCSFLCADPASRSSTSICLKVKDAAFNALSVDEQKAILMEMFDYLADNDVAHDIASYKDAPVGIRIWGGATVEKSDIKALLPWLDYAFYKFFTSRRS